MNPLSKLPFIGKYLGHLGIPHALGFAIAALTYRADQALKDYIDIELGMTLHQTIKLIPFFDLTRVHNYGTSMGLFTSTSPEQRAALLLATGGIALVIAVWMLLEKHIGEIAGLALILGGALGNIVDRKEHGYVLDYADFHIGTVRPFFIFNLADAAITIGVLIILARALFFSDKGEDNSTEQDPPAES